MTRATSKSLSLRTTVPSAIISQFNMRSGDKLKWEMRLIDGELIVIVEPRKEETLREKTG